MPGATPPWRRAQAHHGEHRPLTVSPGQPRSPGPAPRSLLWLLTGASPASPRLHLLWRFGQVVAVTVHVGRPPPEDLPNQGWNVRVLRLLLGRRVLYH